MRIICLSLILISVGPGMVLADILACRGEDPFWNLDLDLENKTAVFERVGEFTAEAEIGLTALAQGQNEKVAHSLINTMTAFTGIAITAPSSCSIKDDDSYSHRVEFLTQVENEAVLMSGCCRATQSE